MPKTVGKLTQHEMELEGEIRRRFTAEQMCAFFLTKTIRSQYRFDDKFISSWYNDIFDKKPRQLKNARKELVKAYTQMLMFENKYRFHLDYWLRQYQDKLLSEMELFFDTK